MTSLSRRSLLGGALALGAGSAVGLDRPAHAYSGRIRFIVWESDWSFNLGTHNGTVAAGNKIEFVRPVGRLWQEGREYEIAQWHGNWQDVGFGITQLIPSWNAETPPGTWIEIGIRGITTGGRWSNWYLLGRWTSGDSAQGNIHRVSQSGQSDEFARVSTDTLITQNGNAFGKYQLGISLARPVGSGAVPKLRMISAVASAGLPQGTVPVSPVGVGRGKVLNVPAYSQERHVGHFPEYNGGGEAWCSATSTAMVLDYWGRGPSSAETAWVGQRYPGDSRPQVDYAARYTYDFAYRGTGNWPFNAAYAGSRGMRAFVTRLRSLNEAEQFIAAGIPLIVSTAFSSWQLAGAGYSTSGHLMVIVGFDSAGNVVVNDPASHLRPDDSQVRVTYQRAQFENAWIPKGGVTYVYAPLGRSLPPAPWEFAWWG